MKFDTDDFLLSEDWFQVESSSAVDSLRYFYDLERLDVKWKNGSITSIEHIDESTAIEVWNSDSVGKWLNERQNTK